MGFLPDHARRDDTGALRYRDGAPHSVCILHLLLVHIAGDLSQCIGENKFYQHNSVEVVPNDKKYHCRVCQTISEQNQLESMSAFSVGIA